MDPEKKTGIVLAKLRLNTLVIAMSLALVVGKLLLHETYFRILFYPSQKILMMEIGTSFYQFPLPRAGFQIMLFLVVSDPPRAAYQASRHSRIQLEGGKCESHVLIMAFV